MSQVFPYGITLQEGGNVALFPAAEVLFQIAEGEHLSLFLIIDSGATISALPKSDAAMLGIDYDRGLPITVAGIGTVPLQGRRHEIFIRLGDEKMKLPVIFLDSVSAPRVLGREGVFSRFTLVFDEDRRRSAFITDATQESKKIRAIIDVI